ncbi:hypothetical protein P692DRAFT_201866437 [Suillus brevipes Sb2]|nr:hypothetical protein P692DRAFT_201866437 [Suillus brevipes Sb2]
MGDELGGSISIARNLDKRIPTRSYSQAASLSNTRNHMTEFQPRRMWDESEPNDPLPSPEFPYRPSNANYTPVTPTRRGLGYKRRLEATTSPSASPNNARQTKRRPAEHMTMVNDVVQREHDSEIETDIYSETRSEQGWIADLNHHLTKAAEALDNISIHAKFPDNMCIAAQRIAQAILPPKPVETPRNNPDDIMPILNQLVKDVQELRQGNKLETSQDSRTQIANGPIITPTPKTKTNSTKITEQENRRRNNPLTRHHPSRLILHIETPPDPTQRQKDRGLVEAINERLKEVTKVTVNGVKWNTKGNCIVITHPDYTADDLLPFKDAFADLIVGNSNYSAAPDKEWFRVLLNSVDTGKSDAEDVMEFEPRTGAEVIYEMKTNNPSVRNINFKTEPSWMAKPENLEHKYHSTMLLTVSSQEEVDYLLKHVSGVFLYGWYASFSRFQDLKPVRQCNRCVEYAQAITPNQPTPATHAPARLRLKKDATTFRSNVSIVEERTWQTLPSVPCIY